MDTVFDTWGMYNRESTSYTAWKVNETFGNMPTSWAGGYTNGTPSGNAKNWPQDAQNSGFTTSTTPKIHTVAIRLTGATGLSAWVEAVDDNNVTVSLYNNDGTGSYSVETVPAGLFSTYIYFN